MSDCPEINIDSLYLSYIPLVVKTENDWEYFKNIHQFLHKFNNGHVFIIFPDYIVNQLDKLYPQTKQTKEEEFSESLLKSNLFITDSENDFAYIKFPQCNIEDFHNFFLNNYDSLMNFKNLIVDVWYNAGGDGGATAIAKKILLDQDTIYYYPGKVKTHNSFLKARAAVKIHYYEQEDVSQDFKDKYYSYYYNNHFEPNTFFDEYYLNQIDDSLRFKGNVYVIAGEETASAGEDFVLCMSEGKKVKTFGKKTMGAFGQPLVTFLKSGAQVFINTTKTYDYKGNEISTGFVPEYDYDFSDLYKIEDKQEMLSKFIEIIKSFEQKE
jgi:C-terminal processing protease CtpA/Prc